MNELDEFPVEAHFRKHIFYIVLDNVIGGLTVRVNAAKQISDSFSFLWNYQKMSKEELKRKAAKLVEKYSNDISGENLMHEMNHITVVHNANFGSEQLVAMELLNALTVCGLKSTFQNLSVIFRMFLTAPVTVASTERSFSKLKLITSYLRTSVDQDRVKNQARLSI